MADTVLVVLIVAAAALYLGRMLKKSFSGSGGSCGCKKSGCGTEKITK